ncbi:hypothetical protein P154DRAFT_321332 [Amniculicola lignicola CBS 123094]|uniref:Uncharacterized protein n=1 Tax=Amniculicola lignicola CBS 123094 TaxID=1392246 RepID=A0A6A5W3H2_9PLEO|nr:hypothetical protein P154DRAFT_321332 [Amniculicola lignicola CBS 123094]
MGWDEKGNVFTDRSGWRIRRSRRVGEWSVTCLLLHCRQGTTSAALNRLSSRARLASAMNVKPNPHLYIHLPPPPDHQARDPASPPSLSSKHLNTQQQSPYTNSHNIYVSAFHARSHKATRRRAPPVSKRNTQL